MVENINSFVYKLYQCSFYHWTGKNIWITKLKYKYFLDLPPFFYCCMEKGNNKNITHLLWKSASHWSQENTACPSWISLWHFRFLNFKNFISHKSQAWCLHTWDLICWSLWKDLWQVSHFNDRSPFLTSNSSPC